jgi:hypothetical protein
MRAFEHLEFDLEVHQRLRIHPIQPQQQRYADEDWKLVRPREPNNKTTALFVCLFVCLPMFWFARSEIVRVRSSVVATLEPLHPKP